MYEDEENKSSFWTCFTIIVGIATVSAAIFAGLTYFGIKNPFSKDSSVVEDSVLVKQQEYTKDSVFTKDKEGVKDVDEDDVDPLFVNLGLSVKWSIRNLGALYPEEFGDYYAWGEIEPKTEFSWSNNKWCKGYYDPPLKYGSVDNKSVLDREDDAAHIVGRTPTAKEMKELLTRCNWTWTTQKGVKGYKVKGPNGNSIFLPAAGFRTNRTQCAGEYGRYWSSSLYKNGSQDNSAYFISFTPEQIDLSFNERFYGHTIRPVKP